MLRFTAAFSRQMNWTKLISLQETHQELAERTGKYVVEFRNEEGNFPRIVAIPTEGAIQRRIVEEAENKQSEDITVHFDPYRGAHKPKSLNQIQGTHPNVLADASSTWVSFKQRELLIDVAYTGWLKKNFGRLASPCDRTKC